MPCVASFATLYKTVSVRSSVIPLCEQIYDALYTSDVATVDYRRRIVELSANFDVSIPEF